MSGYTYNKHIDQQWIDKYPEAFRKGFGGWYLRETHQHIVYEINNGATLKTKLDELYWPNGCKEYRFIGKALDGNLPRTIEHLLTYGMKPSRNFSRQTMLNIKTFIEGLGFKVQWSAEEPKKVGRKRTFIGCPKCGADFLLSDAEVFVE